MRSDLFDLIERARRYKMTEEEQEAQLRSFAFGNTHLEDEEITRADIDRAADALRREGEET